MRPNSDLRRLEIFLSKSPEAYPPPFFFRRIFLGEYCGGNLEGLNRLRPFSFLPPEWAYV